MEIETSFSTYAPDFEIPGIDGQVHHLSRYLETFRLVGVVFISNRCPYLEQQIDRLKQIQSQFRFQGFTLIGINANDAQQRPEDSFDKMKQFSLQKSLNFPYLWDSTQDVAQSFGAEKTPQIFLVDDKAIIRYRGGIDNYLKEAIAALLAGQNPKMTVTEVTGSPIAWRKMT